MKNKPVTEKLVVNSVAYLMEFYDRDSLHDFFHACDDHGVEIGTAFVELAQAFRTYLFAKRTIPDFVQIAEVCAKRMGFPFADYASGEARGCSRETDSVVPDK